MSAVVALLGRVLAVTAVEIGGVGVGVRIYVDKKC
jgi:hypothetical protein